MECAPLSAEDEACAECPAGWGVSQRCSNASAAASAAASEAPVALDTQCQPCEPGATFSDAASRDAPCRACRVCPPNSRTRRACDVVQDAECECERDYYQYMSYVTSEAPREDAAPGDDNAGDDQTAPTAASVLVMECKSCDLCPHGWGAARACSAQHNTVCRKCPAGTFSSVLSASLACSVCSVCRDDQVTLHECTPIQDTVCAGQSPKRIDSCSLHHHALCYVMRAYFEILNLSCVFISAYIFSLIFFTRQSFHSWFQLAIKHDFIHA